MSLDSSDLYILKWIKDNYEGGKLKDILEKLDFTRGNLNYHISHINNYSFKENLPEFTINDNENNVANKAQIILDMIKSTKNKFFLKAEERLLLLIVFLYMYHRLEINVICMIFGISQNTAVNDLQMVKNYLLKNKNVNLKFRKGFYFLEGKEFDFRCLLINIIITIINYRNFFAIKTFLVQTLNEKINNESSYYRNCFIDVEKRFALISQIIEKGMSIIKFIDFEVSTLSLFLFIIFLHKEYVDDSAIEDDRNNESFYVNQQVYEVSTLLVKEICAVFDISKINWDFDRYFLSVMLFSFRQDITLCFDNDEKKKIESILAWFDEQLLKKYYQINKLTFNEALTHYWIWFNHSISYNIIIDISFSKKMKMISENKDYLNFYNDLIEIIRNFPLASDRDFFMAEYKICDLCLNLIPQIKIFPSQNKINDKKAVFITDIKGGLINICKIEIMQKYPSLSSVDVVNYWYYINHKDDYCNAVKLTNMKHFKEQPNFIYFAFKSDNR